MNNVTLIKSPSFGDERGTLIAFESAIDIPFEVKRVYCIYHTEAGVSRGFHAHRNLKQFIVCVSGNCRFRVHDGKHAEDYALNSPEKGLLVEGLIWREMHDFSSDCVLMVLASEHYDEQDYIRDFKQFISITREEKSSAT
ncbi:sugar 3,4-ketoisomerase [Shewanella maritima]|uniref:sugar 3,4-ketoisomerase n=1 Tax=Shewanella maritima TaxID=2520507 RepID=UPI003734D2DB